MPLLTKDEGGQASGGSSSPAAEFRPCPSLKGGCHWGGWGGSSQGNSMQEEKGQLFWVQVPPQAQAPHSLSYQQYIPHPSLALCSSSTLISWSSDRFYFLELQNHCGQWLQPWKSKTLAPWKESFEKLSILKSRDITLLAKVHLVKAMVFPVVTYECESWTIKKAEHPRIDAFKLSC